jgi:hypothetical protein
LVSRHSKTVFFAKGFPRPGNVIMPMKTDARVMLAYCSAVIRGEFVGVFDKGLQKRRKTTRPDFDDR